MAAPMLGTTATRNTPNGFGPTTASAFLSGSPGGGLCIRSVSRDFDHRFGAGEDVGHPGVELGGPVAGGAASDASI